MKSRNEYVLDLNELKDQETPLSALDFVIRPADQTDAFLLARLMIEAYRNTIDYDGESLADANNEVQAFLNGDRGGQPLLEHSRLGIFGTELVSACLICDWEQRRYPIAAYVMTHPGYKGRRLAEILLRTSLQALKDHAYRRVGAVITGGNLPSERLFCGLGFHLVVEG